MHSYLKAVGFSKINTDKQVKELLANLTQKPTALTLYQRDTETTFCEMKCEVAGGFGLTISGEYDEHDEFVIAHYFPYMESTGICLPYDRTIQKHLDRDTFAVMLDEYHLGVSLICFMQSPLIYRMRLDAHVSDERTRGVILNALSVEGKILLPMFKTEEEMIQQSRRTEKRMSAIRAAQHGDEEAMENVSFEDFETYNKISRRLEEEDIYSIVDTSFMASGLESDIYSIVGTITNVSATKNRITGEELYKLAVACNNVSLRVGISRKDLQGEPKAGRRFKGVIWMQAQMVYFDEKKQRS